MKNSALIVCVDPDRLAAYQGLLSPFFDVVVPAGSFADATEALGAAPPRVMVCETRLRESHGLHLALWARVHYADVRTVLIGEPDATLERDAAVINVSYVASDDPADVLGAALEAASREQPRRRWPRLPLTGELAIDVGGRPARILDMSYGGLRFEILSPQMAETPSSLALDIPRFGLTTLANCRWTTAGATPGALLCGASLSDEDVRPRSRWRGVVDAVTMRAPSPAGR